VEKLEKLDSNFWKGRRVLVSGHTGFKGSWLTLALKRLGAQICGYSLTEDKDRSLFYKLDLSEKIFHHEKDILDRTKIQSVVRDFQPEIVYHLAAQSIVERGIEDPAGTFLTNVGGTVELLEACRRNLNEVQFVNVTTDKVYQPAGTAFCSELNVLKNDGDPYAVSKVCAELIARCYRSTYFQDGSMRLVTVRAGNVIGFGDFMEGRLLPDLILAYEQGRPCQIRNPEAVRPWQGIGNILYGYLLLGQRLMNGGQLKINEINFGPDPEDHLSVGRFSQLVTERLPLTVKFILPPESHRKSENIFLDSTLAKSELGWRPIIGLEQSLDQVAHLVNDLSPIDKKVSRVVDQILGRLL
jgi:CDP-glucose 4,6-dehydratase